MTIKLYAARGIKWQATEILGRQFISLAVFTTLARLLNPAAFGLVGLVGVYLAFVGMFVDQGIGTALVQRNDLEPQHINAAFWFNVFCAVILCLCTVSFASTVAQLFSEPRLIPLLRWGSVALVINATAAVHSALFVRAMDFRRPMIRTLIANTLGGGIGVGMALAGYGVWALIGQQITASLAGACFLWIASPWRPSLRFSMRHLRQLMGVSSSVFATAVLWFFSCRFDQIVVGRFSGATVLGQYVIGGKLCDMARMAIHQPLAAVSIPTLSRLQADHERMRGAIYKGMELNALISFAAFVGLAVVAHDLVPLAFGATWGMSARVCSLYSLYVLVNALQVFFDPALLASGGQRGYVILNVAHAIGVAIACTLGMRFSVNVMIICLITNGLLIAIPALFYLRSRIGLSPRKYCQPCLVPAISALGMAGTVWAVRAATAGIASGVCLVAIEIAVGIGAYAGGIAIFSPISFQRLADTVLHAFEGDTRTSAVLSLTRSQ